MARLIEIQNPQQGPASLRVKVGDMIVVGATGGHMSNGGNIVELVGFFLPGVATPAGEVIAPAGSPSRIVLRALQVGRAIAEIVSGDPFGGPVFRASLSIEVEA